MKIRIQRVERLSNGMQIYHDDDRSIDFWLGDEATHRAPSIVFYHKGIRTYTGNLTVTEEILLNLLLTNSVFNTNPLTSPDDTLQQLADGLIQAAMERRKVITIEVVAKTPLAMGNYAMVANVRDNFELMREKMQAAEEAKKRKNDET